MAPPVLVSAPGDTTRRPAAPVVQMRGVTRRFGSTIAVDGIDLEVRDGEVVALLGPSGCGKTTLLRLVAGFLRPDDGRILIGGEVVADASRMVPPETRRIGMVFQDFALFPHLDVARNIGFGLPRRAKDRRDRIAEVVALVGLEGLERRFPHQLSGGQQQRVALGRALAPRPKVVLMDEPFSNLDAALRAKVRADVRQILTRSGTTAIVVTHDQEEALSLADHVVVMNAGQVLQADGPQAVYRQPADRFVATFVGDSNFIAAMLRGGRALTEIGEVEVPHGGVDGPVELAVRPEDLLAEADPRGAAVVRWCEFYGHDQVLHVALPSGTVLRIRSDHRSTLTTGDRCDVRLIGQPTIYRTDAA